MATTKAPVTREYALREALADDLEFYAQCELKIRAKQGGVEPFLFNRAQRTVHEKIEDQKRRTGYVRKIILKGRQQGISTYVTARFYHKTTHNQGVKTLIMTHEDKATSLLFEMVNRYQSNVSPFIRPSVGISNKQELFFDKLSSGYMVATAGTTAVGRGATVQFAHFSEMAFWPHAETHVSGIMQAIADGPGTEIIIECTANGPGNLFYEMWKKAEAGENEYEIIFVPWFWQDEYRSPVPVTGIKLTEDEEALAKVYKLDNAQVQWRRNKIATMGLDRFKQEYPCNADEAFRTVDHKPFIKDKVALRAMAYTEEDPVGPLVIGCDPGGDTAYADETAIAWRVGRKCLKIETYKISSTQLQQKLVEIVKTDKPAKIFIDVAGIGKSVVDNFREMGPPYSRLIEPVNFGAGPLKAPSQHGGDPDNRRVELWESLLDWLDDQMPVDVPNDQALFAELIAPTFWYHEKTSKLMLESKRDMHRRGQKSTNRADALALTLARPVRGRHWHDPYKDRTDYGRGREIRSDQSSAGASPWATA